jgi:hypothetical protein
VFAGCGYAEYETRLNESKRYFAYLEKIESSLAPKWVVAGNLMEMRVPRQFVLIPAPQPIQNPDGTTEQPTIDSRQPDYLNLTLPGLFGAWQAPFRVVKPTGTEDCQGYIYALSNYYDLGSKQASEATEFTTQLKELLKETLKEEVKDESDESFPPGQANTQYQTQLTYNVFRIKGAEINGTKYTFEVYSRSRGNVIGAILIVLPVDMEMPSKELERISTRIPMMLATFDFTQTPPAIGESPSAPPQPKSTGASF